MKKIAVLIFLLVSITTISFAGGKKEAEPKNGGQREEPVDEKEQVPLKLPKEAQVHYNLDDYEDYTGKTISTFKESPAMAEMVSKGELPTVEKRLPQEPVVVVPYYEVGKYGGTITLPAMDPNSLWPASQGTTEYFFTRDMRYPAELLPSIATGYQFSNDNKTLTITFREGMKWSDGHSFTADDIIFWWNDYILNKELTPSIPSHWKPGGVPMKVTKVDNYTVQYDFSIPYPTVIYFFCQWANNGYQSEVFLPKHAFEKYHIKYNKDADELAKENGFNEWWELFLEKSEFHRDSKQFLDVPYMGPWIPKTITQNGVTWERNPYYFKVDIEGNQLPYIDEYKGVYYNNFETLKVMAISGDFDYVPFGLAISDMPVISENRKMGNYYTIETPGVYGSECAIFVNNNYTGNPEEAEILRNPNFKQALSLALNRKEMNDIIAYGKAVVTQAAIDRNAPWFKEEWARAYADYDVDLANQLLDEMGMDDRDREGYRLTPSGKRFTLSPEFPSSPATVAKSAELVDEYWKAIGIRTNMKSIDYATMEPRINAGELMISAWPLDGVDAVTVRLESTTLNPFRPDWTMPLWFSWVRSDGETGEEPPQPQKDYIQWVLGKPYVTDNEFSQKIEEILDWSAEDCSTIGTFAYMPMPTLVRNGLGNVDAVNVFGFSHPADGTKSHRPETFFWK